MITQSYVLEVSHVYGNIAELSCRYNNLDLVIMWHLMGPLSGFEVLHFILLALILRKKNSLCHWKTTLVLTWDKLSKTAAPATITRRVVSCIVGLYLVSRALCCSPERGIAESLVGPLFLQSWFRAAMFKQVVVVVAVHCDLWGSLVQVTTSFVKVQRWSNRKCQVVIVRDLRLGF